MKWLETVKKNFCILKWKIRWMYISLLIGKIGMLKMLHYLLWKMWTLNLLSTLRFCLLIFQVLLIPHSLTLLCKKIIDVKVNPCFILWIRDFVLGRVQYVNLNDQYSDILMTNTGAPQGCVLSPLVFSLYTNDYTSTQHLCKIFEYTDDCHSFTL